MAHSLLRHLRNAAHGKITNENCKKNILSDYNENKRPTMRARSLTSFCLVLFRCYTNLSIKFFPFQKNGIYWVRHLYYG